MVKERWSTDPNGETWAKDETKFGQKMLEKMGWSEGKGLGASESGNTEHVKVKKRAVNLGLGADQGTPDRWTEHITDFDDILSKLNANSEPNSAVNSDTEEKPSEKTAVQGKIKKRRKRDKNLYTKFKKHKNLSSLSEKDMAHIFGEHKQEIPVPETKTNEKESVKDESENGDITGVKTTTSSLSLAEYFNLKKQSISSKKADTQFKFGFGFGGSDETSKQEEEVEEPGKDDLRSESHSQQPDETKKSKKKKKKRTDVKLNH